MHATLPLMEISDFPAIRRRALETVQVNLGYRCNQSCVHCHVNAGPTRTEAMSRATVFEVIAFLKASGVAHARHHRRRARAQSAFPHAGHVCARARRAGDGPLQSHHHSSSRGRKISRSSSPLTGCEVVASLPCYLEDNVDRQRGKGVFEASIRGLQRLNALGYGRADSGLDLNLVYNPQGPVLPPPQAGLERDYRRQLLDRYGIAFNRLYVLTNMPIQRFGSMLISKGQFEHYMDAAEERATAGESRVA